MTSSGDPSSVGRHTAQVGFHHRLDAAASFMSMSSHNSAFTFGSYGPEGSSGGSGGSSSGDGPSSLSASEEEEEEEEETSGRLEKSLQQQQQEPPRRRPLVQITEVSTSEGSLDSRTDEELSLASQGCVDTSDGSISWDANPGYWSTGGAHGQVTLPGSISRGASDPSHWQIIHSPVTTSPARGEEGLELRFPARSAASAANISDSGVDRDRMAIVLRSAVAPSRVGPAFGPSRGGNPSSSGENATAATRNPAAAVGHRRTSKGEKVSKGALQVVLGASSSTTSGSVKWPYLLYISMEPVAGVTLDVWLKQRVQSRLLPAPSSIPSPHSGNGGGPRLGKRFSSDDFQAQEKLAAESDIWKALGWFAWTW